MIFGETMLELKDFWERKAFFVKTYVFTIVAFSLAGGRVFYLPEPNVFHVLALSLTLVLSIAAFYVAFIDKE